MARGRLDISEEDARRVLSVGKIPSDKPGVQSTEMTALVLELAEKYGVSSRRDLKLHPRVDVSRVRSYFSWSA